MVATFPGTMVELAAKSITLDVELNGGNLHHLEYFVGLDNPGFHLKIDDQIWQEMLQLTYP